MDDRPVEQSERMGTGPPARSIGREAAVSDPYVSLIFLHSIELTDVFRETDSLEGPHVFPAGEDISPLHRAVYCHHQIEDEIIFTRGLPLNKEVTLGPHEIAPQQGRVHDCRNGPSGNLFLSGDFAIVPQRLLRVLLRLQRVVHHMQGKVIRPFRVNAIPGKSSSQSIRPVVQ